MKRFVSIFISFVILVSSFTLNVFAVDAKKSSETKRYSVLVLDVSGTATFEYNGLTIYKADSAIDYVKTSATSFLSELIDAKGDNYVAVVTFAEEAKVVSGFTDDIGDLTQKVNSLSQHDTVRDINAGISTAKDLLQDVDDTAIKNVVLVTTGMTNSGKYSYDGHYDKNTIASNWYRTDTGVNLYAYANSAYEAANDIKNDSTLYVLGLFQTMEKIPEKGRDVAEFFKLTASDLATSQNTFYDVEDPSQLEFVFGEIADDITTSSGYFKYAGMINQDTDSTAEYKYSDSYFNKQSTIYNPSLATMSLCLELSSWSSYDKENWYNSSYTSSDSEFWNDKLYNIKSLLIGNPNEGENGGIGFSHFKANSYWQSAPTKDSIGVCAARKQIQDKNGNTYTLIALVIRGGGYGAEWASNFTLGESGEHKGFAQARDNTLNFLDAYVNSIGDDESKNLKIWITGYSRAGATANMVAGALDSYHVLPSGFSTSLENIYCYTFEAPQGAVRSNLSGNYNNIFNVVNLNDLVPLVAPYSWDFSRYNYQNDIPLPFLYTTDHKKFYKELEAMKTQLGELGYSNFDYKINEISPLKNFKMDKSKFLPGGDPLWWWEETKIATQTVLEDGIKFVADDVIPSREYYYENLEYCIRQLMGIIMDYYGAGNGLVNYAGEVAINQFLSQFNNLFSFENITYILSPIASINPFYSFNDRIKDVKARLAEKVGGIFEEFTNIEGFIDSIVELLTDVFVQVAKDVWNNNTDSINIMLKFANTIITSEFQGHYPEICLAWCRSLDPNYNNDEMQNTSSITRIVRINCPVDVNVYDSNGTLVASVVNNVSNFNNETNEIIHLVNNKDEKLFYLPGDEAYSVEILATNDGTVNYSISEYNFVYFGNTRLQNYYDIPIKTGDSLKAVVPAILDNELIDNDINGSSTDYTLYHNDSLLNQYEEFNGEQVEQEHYSVAIETQGNGGYADGAGEFIKGSFAKLNAYTLSNGKFLGWYKGEELLSTETEYRFAVKNDVTITAKFNDVDFYKINIEQNNGGIIDFKDDCFPVGTEISMKAIPNEGYVFEKWISTNGGVFENYNSAETIFTTGEGDTTLSAVFTKLSNGDATEETNTTEPNSATDSESTHSTNQNTNQNSNSSPSPKDKDVGNLSTGDNTNIALICTMIICSIIVIVVLYKKRKIAE